MSCMSCICVDDHSCSNTPTSYSRFDELNALQVAGTGEAMDLDTYEWLCENFDTTMEQGINPEQLLECYQSGCGDMIGDYKIVVNVTGKTSFTTKKM